MEVEEKQNGILEGIIDILKDAGDENGSSGSSAELPSPSTESHRKDNNNNSNDTSCEKAKLTPSQLLLLASLYLAFFLPTFNHTIVSTSLPKILSDINVQTSDIGYTWVGSIYPLSQGMVISMFSHLAHVSRRKWTFLAAMAIFMLGSALCGASVSLEMLIAARVVQGIGAGGISGVVFVLLHDLVGGYRVHVGKYHELASATWAVASALGPLLGGVFAEKTSWRWCFLMNIPICLFCIVVIYTLVPPNDPTTTLAKAIKSVDIWGITAVGTGKILILLAIQWITQGQSWQSPYVLTVLLAGLSAVAMFIRVEFVTSQPVIPFRLFDHRTRIGAYLASFFHSIAFSGLNYWLPLYFQAVKRQSSSQSGVSMLPWIVAFGVTSTASSFLIEAFKRYQELIWSGFILATIGCGLTAMLNSSTSGLLASIFLAIAGLGFGPNFNSPLVPIHASLTDSVHNDNNGGQQGPSALVLSTSAFVFLRAFGSSVGISISGLVFFEDLARHQMPSLTVFNLTQAIEHANGLTQIEEAANLGVLSVAMRHVFTQVAIVVGAGLLVSLLIARHPFDDAATAVVAAGFDEERHPGAGRVDSFGADGG